MSKGCSSFEAHENQSLGCLQQIIGINMNVKGTSEKSSEENKGHVPGKYLSILYMSIHGLPSKY